MTRNDDTTINRRPITPAYFLGRPSAVYVDRYTTQRASRRRAAA